MFKQIVGSAASNAQLMQTKIQTSFFTKELIDKDTPKTDVAFLKANNRVIKRTFLWKKI
jgi:hypothetical protein